MLKPGEAEAIAGWWRRSHGLQGAACGMGVAVGGFALVSVLYAFISAFIDLN